MFNIALVIGFAILMGHGANACPSTYPLVAGGSDGVGHIVGEVVIAETISSTLDVTLTVSGDLTPNDTSDDASPTLIYRVQAEANCEASDFPLSSGGAAKPTSYAVRTQYEKPVVSATVSLSMPRCGREPILVSVRAQLTKGGGSTAFESLFPTSVMFVVTTDAGDDAGASYYDTMFTGSSLLTGLEIDGYCVDVEHGIDTGVEYSATAYHYLDPALKDTNIDKPENMVSVAWVINHFFPGTSYTADIDGDGTEETYTLSSGTLQRAIWYIIDDGQARSGLGAFDDGWARYIADLALYQLNYLLLYEPGCGDLIPVVLVPDSNTNQHTTIQTTFAGLNVPCHDRYDKAWAVMPETSKPLGFRFNSTRARDWATYVELAPCV